MVTQGLSIRPADSSAALAIRHANASTIPIAEATPSRFILYSLPRRVRKLDDSRWANGVLNRTVSCGRVTRALRARGLRGTLSLRRILPRAMRGFETCFRSHLRVYRIRLASGMDLGSFFATFLNFRPRPFQEGVQRLFSRALEPPGPRPDRAGPPVRGMVRGVAKA